MSNILYYSTLLRTGKISSSELTKIYLERIEKLNPKLNAYIKILPEYAIAQAKKCDEILSKEEKVSPLTGVPMALKDNLSVLGLNTTCCSKMLENFKSTFTATAVTKLFDKGAVMLGKTNLDEFAMGSYCNTGIYGPARNPYDLGKSPGGSSGGNASAVSAGIAPYTLGTDTGGSTRQPASYCGIVALKPTYGSVSRYGLLTLASSFDQIAPMTSTVTDCAIVYDAICGHDPEDMMTFKRNYEPTYPKLSGEIKGLRIGISDDFFATSSTETNDSVMKAVDFYVSKGAEIVKVKLPHIKYALPIYYILGCAEVSSNFGRFDGIRYGYKTSLPYKDVDDMITKTRTEGLGMDIKRRIMLGIYFLSKQNYKEYFQKASMMRNELIGDFSNAFNTCDLILSPTSPTSAVSLDFTPETIVEKYYADACVAPANLCGLPALALPCGLDKNGMPLGMQLMGPNFSEGTLFNAGYAFERECSPELNPTTGVNYDI